MASPQELVSRTKQRRLTRLARWYLKQHRLENQPARFDVVAISWQDAKPEINWIPMPSMPVIESTAPPSSGTLFLVATPIGNLADITLRALEVLRSVHLIAAEDTRHTRKLLSFYDIHKPLISYHSHNLRERGPELLAKITAGTQIALVTDAGTPGISDPGALLVQQALERNLPVVVIPGPTA